MRARVCCLLVLAGCASARASADPPQIAPVPRSSTAIDAGDEPGGSADFRVVAARAANPYDPAARRALEDFLARHPHHHQRPAASAMLAGVLLLQGDSKAAKAVVDENDGFLPSAERDFFGGLCAARVGDASRGLELLKKYIQADPPLRIGGLPDHDVRRLLRATLADALAATGKVADGIDQLELYAQIESDRPSERAFALDHAVALAAAVSEPTALDAMAGRRGLFVRAVMGPKAVTALRARGDAAGAARLDQEVMGARRQLGLEPPLPSSVVADPLRVGLVAPLSGSQVRLGEVILRGAAVAVTSSSGAGEPSPFQLAVRDSAAPPDRSALGGGAAAGIIALAREERVIGVAATPDPRAGELAARENLPLVLLDERTAPTQTTAFSLIHSAEARAVALGRRALALGARRFVILHPDNASGKRLAAAFRRAIEEGGGAITGQVSYAPTTTSFATQVAELRRVPFDGLFVPDDANRLELIAPALAVADIWPRSPRLAFSSARSAASSGSGRRESLLLSTALGISTKLLRDTGRYLQGAMLCPGYYPTEEARGASFVSRFRGLYGTSPTATDAYGHDAAYVLRSSVERGAKTRGDVVRVLSTQTFEGLTGDIRFGPNRNRIDPPLVYYVDGESVRTLK